MDLYLSSTVTITLTFVAEEGGNSPVVKNRTCTYQYKQPFVNI